MKYTSARITREWNDISGAIYSITSLCQYIVVYEHSVQTNTVSVGGKTHIHLCLSHYCDRKTIKNTILKKVKLSGNQDWKFAEWDADQRAVVYMTKGKLDPVYVQNYDVTGLKTKWVEPSRVVVSNNPLVKYYRSLVDGSNHQGHPLYEMYKLPNEVESRQAGMLVLSYPRFQFVKSWFYGKMIEKYILPTPAFFRDRKTFTLGFCREQNIKMPPAKDAWESE